MVRRITNTAQVLGPDTDQEAAWHQLGMARMVDRVAAGYSATFLAYGQVWIIALLYLPRKLNNLMLPI